MSYLIQKNEGKLILQNEYECFPILDSSHDVQVDDLISQELIKHFVVPDQENN